MTGRMWVSDIQGAITIGVIVEYLHLWDILLDLELQPGVNDTHLWKLSVTGMYSATSAYEGLFLESISFEPYERIWTTWAPTKCRFFIWLVAHRRCWTADRLAHRGMDHLEHCPLCDQEDETIDQLLVSYVFARQFWFLFLPQSGL